MTRPRSLHRTRPTRRLRTVLSLAIAASLAGALAGAGAASAEDPLITEGPSGPTSDATPTFAWTANGTATCTVDGAISYVGCTSPFGTGELADGPHVVEIEVGGRVEARTFVVDTLKPLVEAAGDEGTRTEPTATITFDAEPGAATSCAVDDGEYAACTSPWTTPALGNRTHVLHVRATDAAGNVGETHRIVRMEVAPPETTIVAGPIENDVTAERRPSFSFTASRPASGYRCAIDDGKAVDCGSSWAPSEDLSTGVHTLKVAAIDQAGNLDLTPAERRFTVAICQETATIGAVEVAAPCLYDAGGGRLGANGPVKVNGLTFNPRGRAGQYTILIDTAARTITLRDIQMRMGSIVLYQGDLEFPVPAEETFTLASIDTDTKSKSDEPPADSEAALDLKGDDDAQAAGLPIRGTAKLELSKGKALLTASVELPKAFTDAEGRGLTGELRISSDNANGFKLAGAKIAAPLAYVGKVELQNLSVAFIGDGDGAVSETCNLPSGGLRWEGKAETLVFPAPGKPKITNVGFGLADGAFAHAEGTLVPGGDGAELGAGIRVTKLSVSLCAGPPVRIEGRAGLTALPGADGKPRLIIPDAGLIYTGPDQGKSWTIRAETPQAKIAGDIPITFDDLFLQVGGNGAVDFGGKVRFSVPLKGSAGPVSLDAKVDVEASAKGFVEGSRYNVELAAKGCFAGSFEVSPAPKVSFDEICPQVEGLISSTGFAVCGALTVKGKSIGRVGAGKAWDGELRFMSGSCDLGPWRVARELPEPPAEEVPPTTPEGAAARRSAVGERRFSIPAGARNVLVALRGDRIPPRVELVGPNGERIPTPVDPGRTARTDHSVAFTNRALATTYVGLSAPRAGTWTARPAGTAADGAVQRIAVAPLLAPARISGRLAGHGRGVHTLTVRATARPGQRITLLERGTGVARQLGALRVGRGTFRFRPTEGPAGRRTIEALIDQDGVPRERRTIATFVAVGPQAPARPAALRLTRTASTLTVRWQTAARAARYGIRIQTADGRTRVLVRDGRSRQVRVPMPDRSLDVSVRVVGLRADNTAGRAATARSAGRRATSSHGSHR